MKIEIKITMKDTHYIITKQNKQLILTLKQS